MSFWEHEEQQKQKQLSQPNEFLVFFYFQEQKTVLENTKQTSPKSSKDLYVKTWGPSWMDSHIFSKTFFSVNDICKIRFFFFV